MGGKITFFSKFCFGPITVPKGPFGVGMGPTGPKNHKESESGPKATVEGKNIGASLFARCFEILLFFKFCVFVFLFFL